jgi:hypothetical protein
MPKEDHHARSGLLNRRSFLTQAGLFAAGSAFAGPLVSCAAEYDVNLPCLGVVPPPSPVPGTTYIRASEIGCALDCDLRNGGNKHGGNHATDDAPRINAALACASKSNPITLILDGSAMISGLFLPAGGYWSIEGLGCGMGFFVKSGSNCDGIHNGGPTAAIPSDPGPPVPPRGKNVSLRNFVINGNQGNGFNGVSTSGARRGAPDLWYFSINLMNLDNIVVENVAVVNAPSYHMRFSNVGNVTVSGCVLRSKGINTDGLHFDGPANDIKILKCDFTTGDDSIALNCPEGHSGDISRVTVTDCTFMSATFWVRLHTIDNINGPTFKIDTVAVSNCTGQSGVAGFLVGHGAGSGPESMTGVTISDCVMTAPAILEIGASFGEVTVSNVTLTPAIDSRPPAAALARSSSYSQGSTYSGTNLVFNNCVIQRDRDHAVAGVIVDNKSSIKQARFNGFSVQDAGNFAKSPDLIEVPSGSVANFVIDAIQSSNIKSPVSDGGFSSIEAVSGPGVLATGWQFPDSVMADGVPYISASTGMPSIKIDGVVQSYHG